MEHTDAAGPDEQAHDDEHDAEDDRAAQQHHDAGDHQDDGEQPEQGHAHTVPAGDDGSILVCSRCWPGELSRIQMRPRPDGGGDYVCEAAQHRLGGWLDDGELKLGVIYSESMPRNEVKLFTEEWTSLDSRTTGSLSPTLTEE